MHLIQWRTTKAEILLTGVRSQLALSAALNFSFEISVVSFHGGSTKQNAGKVPCCSMNSKAFVSPPVSTEPRQSLPDKIMIEIMTQRPGGPCVPRRPAMRQQLHHASGGFECLAPRSVFRAALTARRPQCGLGAYYTAPRIAAAACAVRDLAVLCSAPDAAAGSETQSETAKPRPSQPGRRQPRQRRPSTAPS